MSKLADKAMSTAAAATEDVGDSLAAVAQSLREASESALELTEEARTALANAATQVVQAAATLRKNSVETAKGAARQAALEIQEHPIVSIAAALAAVGGLVGVILAARGAGKGR